MYDISYILNYDAYICYMNVHADNKCFSNLHTRQGATKSLRDVDSRTVVVPEEKQTCSNSASRCSCVWQLRQPRWIMTDTCEL